jgi:hypothetical protein
MVLSGLTAEVQANERGVRGTMITPSQCQLAAGAATLVNGAFWRVIGGAVGAPANGAALVCPIVVTNVDVGNASDQNEILSYRLHFRDSDSAGSDASISINVHISEIRPDGGLDSTVDPFNPAPTTSSFTTATHFSFQELEVGKFRSFIVSLNAKNGGEADFAGFDFPP